MKGGEEERKGKEEEGKHPSRMESTRTWLF